MLCSLIGYVAFRLLAGYVIAGDYSKSLMQRTLNSAFNFKERLCNVKLKDIDAFAKKHMSKNWVTERTKTLKNVG